ncbi:MAG TPA: dihydroneopterin aldolase [Acidimicrobiales bacterium]|nr:dihydroneopterin aldolase [Acidimicrobiales bacterium]
MADDAADEPEVDRVEVRGLRLLGVHGVHEEELRASQPFEVDLDLEVDTSRAQRSDDLSDTADYGLVLHAVAAVVAGPPRRLLEALASDIADAALAVDHVRAVTVALRKLDPPVPYEVRSTGVRIARRAAPVAGPAPGSESGSE